MNNQLPTLKIVVPCYNEQEALPVTAEKLMSIIDNLSQRLVISTDSGLILVDDGSKDKTWNIITQLNQHNSSIIGIKLSRNYGHQNALMAGLQTALLTSDCCVSIDADLQDDITVIEEMVLKYLDEGCDIVYGVRKDRASDTWFKRVTAQGFYKFMQVMGGNFVYNHADFRLMSNRAVKALFNFRERNLFLRGIVPLIGYKSDKVFYNRSPRIAGESKYPLGKMMSFAVDGLTSFSVKPVRMVLTLGVVFVVIAFFILLWVILVLIQGREISGWASLILSLWFIGGCVLIGLGIVGEYIGKIYIEVKCRPRYVVDQVLGVDREKAICIHEDCYAHSAF